MNLPSPNGSAPAPAIGDWLQRRPTPIYWLMGPAGSGKSEVVRTALAKAGTSVLLPLSAASPDRCLQQFLGVRTTRELFDRLGGERGKLLVLDALETVQDPHKERAGLISDLRLRHLLAFVGRATGPDVRIVVTSRLAPPRDLDASAITLIELAERQQTVVLKAARQSGPPSVLEVLASSRKASSEGLLGWLAGLPGHDSSKFLEAISKRDSGLLARLTGWGAPSATKSVCSVLEDTMRAGLVHPVELAGCSWFQMTDVARAHFLSEPRAAKVHLAIAEKLESEDAQRHAELTHDTDPELGHDLLERAIEHRLAAGDILNAILCYWTRMGNFSQLDTENALHVGARACRALIQGVREISADFKQAPGAAAVVNDLATYALCLGDAKCATESALAANAMAAADMRPWDQSVIARHVAQGSLMRGELGTAMHWAEQAKRFARNGLRLTEGLPADEIVAAYEHASHWIIRIAAASTDTEGADAILADLVAAHAHWRRKLDEYNRNSVITVDAPTRPFNTESVLDGQPAALVALLGGKPHDAVRILGAQLSQWSDEGLSSRHALAPRTLLLQSHLAAGNFQDAKAALPSLQALAEGVDDTDAQCEVAAAGATLAMQDGNAAEALRLTDQALILAESCDLGLRHNELLGARSKALVALGRTKEAQAAAGMTKQISPAIVDKRSDWPQLSRSDQDGHTAGAGRRVQLHERAVQAIEDHKAKGIPYALYFRKYHFTVAHGPMEFGPRLTENVLYDAMPRDTNLITIQDHRDFAAYTAQSFGARSAPALFLEDEHWEEVAKSLIPSADLIVSECYMLSPAVRLELETAYQTNKWDKTVLLLPPHGGPLDLVDNDPLIQKFPRAIWMDSFHTEPLMEMPQIRDLVARMGQIACLPDEERSRTVAHVRSEAFPVDLRPLSEHYQRSSQWLSMQQDDRSLYYGFWELFRVGSIRGVLLQRGDTSLGNRLAMADACLQMAAIMLRQEEEGEKIILPGDLEFAEQMSETAHALLAKEENFFATDFRRRAEELCGSVDVVRKLLREQPERFELRRRYGPFPVREADREDLPSAGS